MASKKRWSHCITIPLRYSMSSWLLDSVSSTHRWLALASSSSAHHFCSPWPWARLEETSGARPWQYLSNWLLLASWFLNSECRRKWCAQLQTKMFLSRTWGSTSVLALTWSTIRNTWATSMLQQEKITPLQPLVPWVSWLSSWSRSWLFKCFTSSTSNKRLLAFSWTCRSTEPWSRECSLLSTTRTVKRTTLLKDTESGPKEFSPRNNSSSLITLKP